MNLREGRIGKQEGLCLVSIAMCIGGLFTLEPELTYSSGNVTYVTLPIASLFALLVFCFAAFGMRKGRYKCFNYMLKDTCGETFSCIVSIVLIFCFALTAIAPLSNFIQIMHGLFYSNVSNRQLVFYVLPGVLIVALMGFETIGRTAKCMFAILILATVLTLIAALGEYDSYRLYPLPIKKTEIIVNNSFSETAAFLPALMALLICNEGMNDNRTMMYVGIRSALITAIVCATVQFFLGMIFPYSQLKQLAMPLCRINHMSVEETNITRLDKIAQIIWLNGSMLSASFYIYAGALLFSKSFKINDIRPPIVSLVLVATCLALIELDGLHLEYSAVFSAITKSISLIFMLILIFPSIISLLKNRRKKNENKA